MMIKVLHFFAFKLSLFLLRCRRLRLRPLIYSSHTQKFNYNSIKFNENFLRSINDRPRLRFFFVFFINA